MYGSRVLQLTQVVVLCRLDSQLALWQASTTLSGDHCGRSTWTTCHLVNTWQWWRRPEITVVALPGRHVTWSTAGSDGGGRRSLWSLYLDAMSPGQHLAVMATAGVTALAILVGGCWTYRHRCRPSDNDSTAADRPHGIIFYHFTSRSCILKKITRAENEDFLHFLKHGNRALELAGTSWHLLRDGLLYSRRPPSRTQRSQNDATGRYPAHDDAVTSLAASPF